MSSQAAQRVRRTTSTATIQNAPSPPEHPNNLNAENLGDIEMELPEAENNTIWDLVMATRQTMIPNGEKSSTHSNLDSFISQPDSDRGAEPMYEDVSYNRNTDGISPDARIRQRFLAEASHAGE